MFAPGIRSWLGRAGIVPSAVPALASLSEAPSEAGLVTSDGALDEALDGNTSGHHGPTHGPIWPRERILITDSLWGSGYQFPGGEIETLRLAKPLGLSAASSLLLVGAGSGGPACSLATQLGVWVSGYDADQALTHAALDRIAHHRLDKRVQAETWDPARPDFPLHYYHHCLALEPLRGTKPEPTLAALAGAIKPGGQLMMTELVADTALDPRDPTVRRWAELEHRDPSRLVPELGITRVLRRLGFDVRIAENISRRHMDQALLGWRMQVRAMEEIERPSASQAALLVREAELWLMRLRLFRSGRLRMVRWHALSRP